MIDIVDKYSTTRLGKKKSIEEYEITNKTDKTREILRNFSLGRSDQ